VPIASPLVPGAIAWPEHDVARRDYQSTVYDVSRDDWDHVLRRWMEDSGIDPVRLDNMGQPDTSDNLLAQVTAQLTTPGRYGHRPTIRHPSPLARWLISDGARLDQGFWAPVMQTVEKAAFASGDCLLHAEIAPSGVPVFTPIFAHEAYAEPFARDPATPRSIWWARRVTSATHVRRDGGGGAAGQALSMTVFKVWTLPEHEGEEPVYYLRAAEGAEGVMAPGAGAPMTIVPGQDVTAIFSPHEPRRGDAYPWRYADGSPFIPIGWFRSVFTGSLWQTYARRGAFLATLQIGDIATAIRASVRASSGQVVISWGLSPPASIVAQAGQQGTRQSIALNPGDMLFLAPDDAAREKLVTPNVEVINPAGNLQQQALYLDQVRAQIAANLGISSSSVTRASANPTSAAALTISDAGRREHMALTEPLYRAADLDFLRKVAALTNLWGNDPANAAVAATPTPWTDVPETGYSIEYYGLPVDANAQRAEREADEFELQKGLVSPVDLWLRRNPGATRQDAVRALAQVERDKRDVMAAVAADGGPAPMPEAQPAGQAPVPAPAPRPADDDEPEDDAEDTSDPDTYDGDMGPDLDDALDDAEEAADAGDDMSAEDVRDALRRLTEAVRARRRQQAGPRA
jgi:hypothetical protein